MTHMNGICNNHKLLIVYQKVSEYDQETPQSQTADQPRHHEEDPQNIYSDKTSETHESKTRRTQSNAYQNKDQHRTLTNNGGYIKQ